MCVATIAWLSLTMGYLNRRKRQTHIRLMLLGIGTDILLVLYLQVTRSAVQTALKFELSVSEQAHIWFSSSALVLYFPILYLGYRLIQGDRSRRAMHVRLGVTALILRTIGFLFMFSMWQG